MRKIYRFSFDTKVHKEVIECLDSIPKSMRSLFLADAILFARKKLLNSIGENINGNTGKSVSADIKSQKSQHTTYAGIDIGSRYTKVVYEDNKSFIFRSIAHQYVYNKKKDNTSIISVNGEDYLVGPDAFLNRPFRREFIGSDLYCAIIGYCLGQIIKEGKRLSGIAIGLPISIFKEKIISKLKQGIKNAQIELNGNVIPIPENIVFVPIGSGVYYDFILSNPYYEGKDMIVIDIGYFYVNFLFIKDGKIIHEVSRTEHSDFEFMLNKIEIEILNKHEVSVDFSMIETVLREKRFVYDGKEYEFNAEEILAQYYIPEIKSKIQEYVAYLKGKFDLSTIKDILVAGGVAEHLRELVKEALIIPEPILANARGYKKYSETKDFQG
ncbi:ParM/StbA family protein [Thermodesulfovibrio thiophilus]|uniref:ParM/StbA family protein n=1 Tax=Thermodesulfovibrio thiophilus TaxID=340095 RepID=UPI000410D0CD|nr:ParM/StbA family protein [Thermodesulfovibrio thiophilus]